MPDLSIREFFSKRKEAWLARNSKASMTEQELQEKQQTCEEAFALSNWLPNAAKRAKQISIATHPCTFSHPSSRRNKNGHTSSIIMKGVERADGLLRAGNVKTEADALGNAAALDVHAFLTLDMSDGKKLLEHLQENSELAQKLLSLAKSDTEEIRNDFLAMVATDDEMITSSKIKQVYFPIDEAEEKYHLLSVLTNSGCVFELRRRVDHLRFSEESKRIRELRRDNQFSEKGYQDIYNLTTIGYGGTKPQNISVLNSRNGGRAHLLASMPPQLSSRSVRLPTTDFFKNTINPKQIQKTFTAFHKLLRADHNNKNIRNARDDRIQDYLDHVLFKMWQVRNTFAEHPNTRPDGLVAYQKQWLFPEYESERNLDVSWLDELIEAMTRHFMYSYKYVLGKSAIQLADKEFKAFATIIEKNKKALL